MPAVMEDPAGPTVFRVSGQPPFPDPNNPGLPADIAPRQVTLRDRQTVATIVPFASRHQVPPSLLVYLCDQLNREIEGGDTYPMMDPFGAEGFADYWFQSFGAVMLLGGLEGTGDVVEGRDWAKECLGSFFIKPNYPGRSSHVCNASFIVTDGSRNRGVGRLMGEAYLDWAPRLGYTYSVFNLVYETNVASCRIWDALGFKRIGRVRACGNLRSHPDRLVDAIIYGRDLGPPGDGDELVSEERFDKIRYYLKYAKYPNGADRAEKSRLRSAATHYKLLEGDKLMLKDKEVIADPVRQYEVARSVHAMHHGGINKTTATIADKYHWSRIKETVSDVIRACAECKELGKTPNPGGSRKPTTGGLDAAVATASPDGPPLREQHQPPYHGQHVDGPMADADRVLALQHTHGLMTALSRPGPATSPSPYANPGDMSVLASSHHLDATTLPVADPTRHGHGIQSPHHSPMLQDQPVGQHPHRHHHHRASPPDASPPAHHPHRSPDLYQPIDPQIISQPHHHHLHHDAHQHHHPQDDDPFDPYPPHADFQALLTATDDDDDDDDMPVIGPPDSDAAAAAAAAVDRDLEMLIEQDDVDQDIGNGEAMQGLEEAPPSLRRATRAERGLYDDDDDGDDDDVGFHGPGGEPGLSADHNFTA
ncbi:hypothetical protein G6O67_001235 [Ophiocordyceps sinensis]|uniref:N-acetyltransferase domain-containing protein n=1 Tax=Ophiocordyceps sinensis TaxID=72228 RepID=A0A8H4PX15_9HYPO|nr:hypothetical protein G6O67_001235 [Ophiocordyceps sinensis]